ncbi:type II toxin-antitoxin system ParD family antitoxin [Sphingomonas sp. CFBP 13603]|uniref:ribbon-helix-helix domain-containing protein n=1 Tax=Sphingomonas sp. CFBP 13603 TaxID=2774040 RepID=UPI001865C33B|nr:type II toxin-antitoxin system ParD family antitoxin [Sphingomonas sp. CFBP 13603]MBE2993549.1 type II toxin-antitoxin system ParD family antitoxin [Sphingomonas sp. CFBP 13603]
MAQIDVSLPDDLTAWADRQVAEGRYESVGAYVVDLVARDLDHLKRLAALQAAVDEGRASGVSERDPFDYLDDLRNGDSGSLDVLVRSWAQGIGSGPPVDGNFNAADIARRGGQSGEAVRKHG